jgi:iron complex outermembrane receptor protein
VLTSLNPSPVLGQKVQTGFETPNGPLTDTQDWSDTTYRVVANFHPADDHLIYVSATSGYKQGGYNSFTLRPGVDYSGREQTSPETHKPASFKPETSISYEVGYKGTLNDGRSQLALNLFTYTFDDLQATCGVPGSPVVVVCNVGTLDGSGIEGTFDHAMNENWRFGVGFATFDSEGTGVQEFCGDGERILGSPEVCEGQPIPNTPELSWFASLDMDYPVGGGALFGSLTWNWEDERPTSWIPFTPETTTFPESVRMQPGYSIGQLVFGYRSNSEWSIAAYVENLTDEDYFDKNSEAGAQTDNPFSTPPGVTSPYVDSDWGPGRPRTAGIRFSYNF